MGGTAMRIRLILLVAVSLTLSTGAFANYKKDYCGNRDYVGNTGAKYPHLHCGKSFFSLSRAARDHINFNGRGNCNKVNEILADHQNQYGSATNPAAITTALEAYQQAGCP
jgi:hypothetical protein